MGLIVDQKKQTKESKTKKLKKRNLGCLRSCFGCVTGIDLTVEIFCYVINDCMCVCFSTVFEIIFLLENGL